MEPSRKRVKFTSEEVEVLVEEVERKKGILFTKFTTTITNEAKMKAWEEITRRVNSVGIDKKNVKDIRKKWSDFSSCTKKKEADRRREMNKTGGGGSNIILTPVQEKVVSILGETAISAFQGGVDTFQQSQNAQTNCNDDNEEDALNRHWRMEFLNENINSGDFDTVVPGTPEASHQQVEPEEIPDAVPLRKPSRKTKDSRLDQVVDVELEKLSCLKRLVQIEEEKLELKKKMFEFKKKKWEAKVAQMNLQSV